MQKNEEVNSLHMLHCTVLNDWFGKPLESHASPVQEVGV